MSTSIFEVPDWANSTQYLKNDIVKSNGFYFYANRDHTSHPSQTFEQTYTADKLLWLGRGEDNGGLYKPKFQWIPSYNSDSEFEPRVKTLKFGDGYEQRLKDGINNSLIKMNLTFEGRSIQESAAIIHFLETREGVEAFLFIPPAPYNSQRKFKCPRWRHSLKFYNNHTITAYFEEVSA